MSKASLLRFAVRFAPAAAACTLMAAPAHAAASVKLPEPSSAALFGIGLAGLLLGRRLAGKRDD